MCEACGSPSFTGHTNDCHLGAAKSEVETAPVTSKDEVVVDRETGEEPSPFAREAYLVISSVREALQPRDSLPLFKHVASQLSALGSELERTRQASTGMYRTLSEGYASCKQVVRVIKE